MRADISALVTLNAVFSVPFRNENGNAALFVSGSALRIRTVYIILECGYRKRIAEHIVNRNDDVLNELDEFRTLAGDLRFNSCRVERLPAFRNVDLNDSVYAGVDSLVVHFNNGFALLEVGLLCHVLHVFDSLVDRHDIGKCEERRLKNGIGSLAHTDLGSLIDSVNGIELDIVVGNVMLNGVRKMSFNFLRRPLAVK